MQMPRSTTELIPHNRWTIIIVSHIIIYLVSKNWSCHAKRSSGSFRIPLQYFRTLPRVNISAVKQTRHKLQLIYHKFEPPVPEERPKAGEKDLFHESIVFSLVALNNDDEWQRSVSRPRRS